MLTRRSVLEGAIAGALGYAVVAAFFAFVNLVVGASPFRTALLFGEALGAGTGGPGDTAGIVLAANGVHLALSLAIGVVAAWIVLEVERYHSIWPVALLVFLAGFIGMVLVSGVVGAELTRIATWGEVTAASVFFTATVGAWIGWRHRALGRDIGRELDA